MNSACCFASAVLLSALTVTAATAPKLRGIVNLPDRQLAALEYRDEHGRAKFPILRIGERDEACKLLAIDAAAGTATVRCSDAEAPLTLRLYPENTKPANGALDFNDASLRQALDIYQALTGRTVVHSPILVHHLVSVQSAPGASAEACARDIEKVLERNETLLKARGKEFALAVPLKQQRIAEAIPEPPPFSAHPDNEAFPPGLIKFLDADMPQVLDVYSELAQRTILRPNAMPDPKITMRSQSPVTRNQVLWLFEAALRLGGVSVVQSGDKFAFVFPSDSAKGAPAVDLTAVEAKIKKPSAPGHLNIHEGTAQELLNAYAHVLGREPLPIPPEVPSVEVSLRTRTPLTVVEKAFALEAVAALNHLAFDVVGADDVAIRHSAMAPTSGGKRNVANPSR